jgi:Protein of unknown function (DUF1116)
MAACKLMLDSAKGFPGSSMVTAMARNGVNFGIQVSGLGDQWFEARAATINGLYFSGYSPADANPDLGDSAITETAGIGGFAMAAAPAIVGFVGGTVEDALAHTQTNAPNLHRRKSVIHYSVARFPSGRSRNRPSLRHRLWHPPRHQHRHRLPPSRHRPNRRRNHQRPLPLFRYGRPSPRSLLSPRNVGTEAIADSSNARTSVASQSETPEGRFS